MDDGQSGHCGREAVPPAAPDRYRLLIVLLLAMGTAIAAVPLWMLIVSESPGRIVATWAAAVALGAAATALAAVRAFRGSGVVAIAAILAGLVAVFPGGVALLVVPGVLLGFGAALSVGVRSGNTRRSIVVALAIVGGVVLCVGSAVFALASGWAYGEQPGYTHTEPLDIGAYAIEIAGLIALAAAVITLRWPRAAAAVLVVAIAVASYGVAMAEAVVTDARVVVGVLGLLPLACAIVFAVRPDESEATNGSHGRRG